jgi:hypothetical protein
VEVAAMDIFHVVIPLRHAAVARSALLSKMDGRDDLFMWTCTPRATAEPICMACESIPEDLMKYIEMLDPEKFERYFFWRVDKDTMLLQETNAASSLKDVGTQVDFKGCISAVGYRMRRIDG